MGDKETIGFQVASVRAAALINEYAIVGQIHSPGHLIELAHNSGEGFAVRFERSWGAEITLSVEFKRVEKTGKHHRMTPKVRVVWPSTGMDPMAAHVALTLHREVVDLATHIQVVLDAMTITDKVTEISDVGAA